MAKIALKVDVDTLRGTKEGVPKVFVEISLGCNQPVFILDFKE